MRTVVGLRRVCAVLAVLTVALPGCAAIPASAAPAPTSPAPATSPMPAPPTAGRSGQPSPHARAVAAALKGHRHVATCGTAKPQPRHYTCAAVMDLDVRGAVPAATGQPQGYGPQDIQSAYQLPVATATGSPLVAVVDAYDAPAAESDLATYRTQFGLPACTTLNGCFRKVNQAGQALPLPPADTTGSWAQEASLDLDAVSAACPNCRLLLVEATSAGADDLDQAVDTAASLGAVAIANSYTSPEDPISLTADDPHYDHPGVAITAASGDSGYQPNADPANGDRVPYPASSPHVIAAGATSLTTDATTARGWAETAWSSTAGASGSGCSAFEPKPAWQPDTGCAHRMVTDVSVVGDPGTGLAVYDSTPFQDSPGHYVVPGWTVLAGTSASAALLAGMYALAGTSVDYPARLAYQAPAAMADVTGGSTGSCAPASWCTAGPGYDGPTGLGTPVALAGMQQPSPAGGFRPLPPTRILDTRLSPGVPVGSKATLPLKVTGVAGVPDGAVSAVAMNVTATNIQSTGYLAVYPHGGAVPGVSNINYIPGRDIPNSVVVPVGDGGVVDLYNGSNGGTTDLVADVTGYYLAGAPTAAGAFGAVAPSRILDTRRTGAVPSSGVARVQVTGRAGVPPAYVSAVVLNVTATDVSATGFVTAYPEGGAAPTASSLNLEPGKDTPNLVIVRVGANGFVDLFNGSNGGAPTNLIADITGYFVSGAVAIPGGFTPVSPTRLMDTRLPVPGSPLISSGSRQLALSGTSAVPASASAVAVNVTVTQPGTVGYLSVFPDRRDDSVPLVSTLNFQAGQDIANAAAVPIGPDGAVTFFNGSNGGMTHVVADLAGYFTS